MGFRAATAVIGGIVFGVMMSMLMPDIIEMAIPGMYELEGGIAGWTLHMVHSAVLGVVFAAIATAAPRSTHQSWRRINRPRLGTDQPTRPGDESTPAN